MNNIIIIGLSLVVSFSAFSSANPITQTLESFQNRNCEIAKQKFKKLYRYFVPDKTVEQKPLSLDDWHGKLPTIFPRLEKFLLSNKGGIQYHLLVDRPGSGKSIGVEMLAASTKATLITVPSSGFGDRYQNSTKNDIADFFNMLRHELQHGTGPLIVLLDECGGLLQSRSSSTATDDSKSGASELLFQLCELQKEQINRPLLIIGTANYKAAIDSAFIRARRFEVSELQSPDYTDRQLIIRHYFKDIYNNFSREFWNNLAQDTEGFYDNDFGKMTELLQNQLETKPDAQVTQNDIRTVHATQKKVVTDQIERYIKDTAREKNRDELEEKQIKALETQDEMNIVNPFYWLSRYFVKKKS